MKRNHQVPVGRTKARDGEVSISKQGRCGPFPKMYSGIKSIVIRVRGSGGETDLPACIIGKSSDLHAMRGATRPGRAGALVVEGASVTVAGAAGKLDGQAFAHEIRSILCREKRAGC